MAAVLLACAAGALYGAVTAALGLAVRRNRDAEAGALATIVVVFGVREAGSAGVAPLLAAVIAVAAFDEPVLVPLVSGTLLIVLGGAMLAWEPERPAGFRLSSGRCSLAWLFLGRSEMIGRRLAVAAVLVVAGGALIGSWR